MASQTLKTGNEGVTPIVFEVPARQRVPLFRGSWIGICDCWWCYEPGPRGSSKPGRPVANWPACYLVSVSRYAKGYAGPDGWVAGEWVTQGYLSYECMLERNPLYHEGHAADHSKRRWGTTSSPSAAAFAEMEQRKKMLEPEELHYSKRGERAERRETKRAYRAAFRQGWRYLVDEDRWVRTGEDLTQPPRQDAE